MAEIPMPGGGSGYSAPSERPFGIMILAILQILSGLLLLVGGIALFIIPFFGLILGGVVAIVGLVFLYVGFGLWQMSP